MMKKKKMKKQIFICMIFLNSILILNAQTPTRVPNDGVSPIWYYGNNLGIGTSTPKSKLVIFEGLDAMSLNSTGLGFNRNVSDGQIFNMLKPAWQLQSREDRFTLEGYNGVYHELFTVLSNGNIGIGTLSPGKKITIGGQSGSVTTPLAFALSNDYSNNTLAVNSKLFLYNIGGAEVYGFGVGGSSDIQYHAGGVGNTIGRHDFYSGNSLKMTIRSSGNIGIGTSSPEYKISLGGQTGSVTTPLAFAFSNDYSNNKLAINSKLFLYNTGGAEVYGISVGSSSDIQYHAGGAGNTLGRHDFYSGNSLKMTIKSDGNVSIFGKLETTEIKVTTSPTADFVFEKDYNLESLQDVEEYINDNKHLKGIQSASEMKEEGLNISEFQIKLLQKIEEMTLYLIDQNKKLQEQNIEINKLRTEILQLKINSK
jgi:hypothetical protein